VQNDGRSNAGNEKATRRRTIQHKNQKKKNLQLRRKTPANKKLKKKQRGIQKKKKTLSSQGKKKKRRKPRDNQKASTVKGTAKELPERSASSRKGQDTVKGDGIAHHGIGEGVFSEKQKK